MSYRRARFLHIDTNTWPAVDQHALPAERRSKFIARHTAVELYIGGSPLREIAKQIGVSSRQLYWLLDRCLQSVEDGQIFGFRALIKGFRTTSYTRAAGLAVNRPGIGNGYAGSFALLLERYPALATWLRHCKRCLRLGYHGVIHQLSRVRRCPVHGTLLEERCGHCGSQTPYWLNAPLLGAPYRCCACRQLYATYLPSLTRKAAMPKQARTSITRARFA